MAEGTELVVSPPRPPTKDNPFKKPSKQDRARWFLFKNSVSLEEISSRLGGRIIDVQKSIDRVQSYQAQTSNEIVDMRRNEMVLNLADKAEAALSRALEAKTIVRRENKKGQTVVVSRDTDHKTQIEAFKQVKELLVAPIPKGGGVNIAVQQNATQQVEVSRRSNFEERLRAARERRGMTNSENVVEVEYADVDETADDDDEKDAESDDEEEAPE
jgi:hypothetical protein